MPDVEGEKSTGRVEAFSDGVFAIAITLLILDIKVPPVAANGTGSELLASLWAERPAYLAYFMSFVVILVMWVNHHRIFTLVRATDAAFMYWNGLLLMLVTIVPFPTSLLSAYLGESGVRARIGAAIYAGHGLAIALAFTALWRHATRRAWLLMPGSEEEVRRLSAQYRLGPLMYLSAFAVAFVSAWMSVSLCLVFALSFSLRGFTQKD